MNRDEMKAAMLAYRKELVRVETPELPDVEVFVRSLDAGERLVLEDLRKDGGLLGDHEFTYLGARDAKGERFFTPDEARTLDGALAGRIAKAVLEVSGLASGAQESAAKKSESSPS
jgi:hypothetical protein